MLFNNRQTTRVGDCEASHFDGLGMNCKTTLAHGNMWLCDECLEKEMQVTASKVIEISRKQDSELELEQDLFNAATVPFNELDAAIKHDDSIPAHMKDSALAAECALRLEKMNAIIFSEEKAQIARKNERHFWQVNMQTVTSRLHVAEQEKYKQYRVDYKPQTPKSVKPKVVKTTPVKFNKTALYDAAKKYGVPATTVQGLVISKHMTPEDAAKHLAQLMGLI